MKFWYVSCGHVLELKMTVEGDEPTSFAEQLLLRLALYCSCSELDLKSRDVGSDSGARCPPKPKAQSPKPKAQSPNPKAQSPKGMSVCYLRVWSCSAADSSDGWGRRRARRRRSRRWRWRFRWAAEHTLHKLPVRELNN